MFYLCTRIRKKALKDRFASSAGRAQHFSCWGPGFEPQADHKNKINPLIISRYQGIFLLRFFTYTYSTSIERHGSSITKVVPIPSWESTNTRPFIFSTISLQIDKPKPAP